ncbi:MAG: DUF5916 domain-containing protein [Bacteroidota bacterium]|nr:DUF5916 domain-containing protein [Bacteroidota bacterium]
MNKIFTVLALVFLFTEILIAADSEGNVLRIKRVQSEITIDGLIDPVWAKADSATNFFQKAPYYGITPTQKTVAKVLATDDALYCLIVAYDNTGLIQVNSGTLDQASGDMVSIMLDTYNDKRSAYKFAVSASGARDDCRMIDDGRNKDYNWDGIWFSEAKVYSWGYVVEIKIPFRSISYDKTLNEWGLDFDRWIAHTNEDLYWNKYAQNEGLRISKFGHLVFNDVKPSSQGINLEVFPVAITNVSLQDDGKYKVKPNAGLDILYNPSPSLTLQLTANPDFAQIEADPYDFNISRYESRFDEKRPFFTQGNEIFMASGKESNSGFYKPLELFYSRRIGKKLPDGSDVPLLSGTKAFGRISDIEYGSLLAVTGEKDYKVDSVMHKEDRAYYGVARIKKQILDNSTLGILFAGKATEKGNSGVLDIDGAFRKSDWQLSYQIARSFEGDKGDFGFSAGFMNFSRSYVLYSRTRYIGENFEGNTIGYVPWKGTAELTTIGGPNWYFDKGYLKSLLLYVGESLNYEKVDDYTDRSIILGINMQFRDNWGYELSGTIGRSKDSDKLYDSRDISLSSWYNISPLWNANLSCGYSKTYNFDRDYLATYFWLNNTFEWKASKNLSIGNDYNMYIENKPDGSLEDITYNARPYVTLTPINNMTTRIYVDNVFLKSADRLNSVIIGFLFSYNFSPKSWIYFAYNEVQNRDPYYDNNEHELPRIMRVTERASVVKVNYLYYF